MQKGDKFFIYCYGSYGYIHGEETYTTENLKDIDPNETEEVYEVQVIRKLEKTVEFKEVKGFK